MLIIFNNYKLFERTTCAFTQAAKDQVRVAVLGASGYTGAEVMRLTHLHPHIQVTALTGEKQAGKVRLKPVSIDAVSPF